MDAKRQKPDHPSEASSETPTKRQRLDTFPDPFQDEPCSKDYTIGWICAIPSEMAAACEILDQEFEGLDDHDSEDQSHYQRGRIGKHNIVIACLSDYGTTPAATVAKDMLRTFKSIKVGLMVGVGAGVPSKDSDGDVRLGDVVVGTPQATYSGVVQWDRGKAQTGGVFERTGSLDKSPGVLRTALSRLKQHHIRKGSTRISYFLETMLSKNPRLREQGYIHQGIENDLLYHLKCLEHPALDASCTACKRSMELEHRQPRKSLDPIIHYGTIASGNQVIKDGHERDRIRELIGNSLKCIEMEAAGLMDNFPCLVIRGICDYADSWKNERWQPYAAATAAAFAKELLEFVQPLQSDREQAMAVQIERLQLEVQLSKIMKWLSPPSIEKAEAVTVRHSGTGLWLLHSEPYLQFKVGKKTLLWLHGPAGCGKTMIMTAIMEDLENDHSKTMQTVLYFYFNYRDEGKQTIDQMMRSLAAQLYTMRKCSRRPLDDLFDGSCEMKLGQLPPRSLLTAFLAMVGRTGKVRILLDALDECATRAQLLDWIRSLMDHDRECIQLIFTSRAEEEIESKISQWPRPFIDGIINIQNNAVHEDIRDYLRDKIRVEKSIQQLGEGQHVLERIETNLEDKSGQNTSRRVTRQIDPLGNPLAEPMLERTLGSLPTLDRTYSWALEGIPPPNLESAIRLLQFLTFSRRPLLIEEAVDAIAIDLNRDPFFDPSYRVPHLTETLQLCSSLVRKVLQTTARSASSHSMLPEAKTKLQLAHPSVKEYFLSSRISSRFKPYFDPVAAETSIERACRAYLLQIDYGSREMFPFVEYSAMYRFDANSTADRHDIAAVELLEKTLPTRSIRNWFRLFDENDLGDHEYWFRSDVVASPLYYCARAGFFRAVRYLLDHGAEINSKGGFYGNALRAAIVRRHEKVVQILLDGGVDVNAHEAHHSSPLIAASNLGWDKIVRALLEKGADVNKRGEVYGGPLQAAAFRGHSRTLQVLLDYGADVDAQGGLYGNALQAASANGHEKIVQMLLDKDANTHSRYESLSGATTAASQMQQQNVADVISGRVVAPRVRRAVPVEGILQRYHQQIMSLEVGPSPPPLLRMPSNLEDGYIG